MENIIMKKNTNKNIETFEELVNLSDYSFIEKLNTEQRINEIAQMLSGKNLSEISVMNAKELLGINS